MSTAPEDHYEPDGTDSAGLADQIDALKRRWLPMLAVFGSILLAAIATAVLWPPTYLSTGTILIEQQEVPLDFVRSAVSSYADERVQVISQRVMTSANLSAIIEKYDLYANQRDSLTRDELIEKMREDIKREMISADVVDPRAGRTTEATIAFAVGYESRSPQTAARVANDLVTLYLQKNLETRKQMAASTTQFLSDETEKLRRRIDQLEQQIADFKSRNYDQLPEFAQANIGLLSRTKDEMRDVDSRAMALSQQIAFLQSQLAQVDPRAPAVTDKGQNIMSPAERLRSLRGQYLSALTIYTPKHPTVANVRRELNVLEQQIGGGDAAIALLDQLDTAYSELAAARATDSANSAEGLRLEQLVGNISARIKNMPVSAPEAAAGGSNADNPAYISLQGQLRSAESERASLQGRRAELGARIADLERRQSVGPEVEREYSAMMRELEGEQTKFAEVRQKLMDAQLSQSLETEQRGERFTLIEPPTEPGEPIRPNRPAIFGIGFVLALAAAVAMMVLLELLDARVRGTRQVAQLLGVQPLAIIPWVADDEPPRFKFWQRSAATAVGAASQ